LVLVAPAVRAPAERVAGLLAAARDRVADGAGVEEVLWEVWSRSGLGERWLAESLAGGPRGTAADRDLDAVVALFDTASRFVDQLPRAGVAVFLDDLDAQEIPADTLAERTPAGDAVRLLTAHRAKGLEWDLVVVAGVQEGRWPDVRLRGSLLGVEELVEATADGVGGPVAATSKLLDEERRLFYVAATRARRRLVVTAVGGDDAEERPSRFLAELSPGRDHAERLAGRSYRWLALPALVADLRATVTDPARPAALRRTAAGHLAGLARAGVRGADPREWFALRQVSDDRPLFPPDAVISVSPSQVELFRTCPLRWLLETAVGARRTGTTVHLGSVIHALAALAGESGQRADLIRRLDDVWDSLDVGSPWFSRREHERAVGMIERFSAWSADDPRTLAVVEESFEALTGRVRIRGRVDRLERDGDGRGVVVDLKTGASRPADDEVGHNPQLGVYQLAVALGAFGEFGLSEPGGAELVQLGKAAFKAAARTQRQPALADDPEPQWAETLVREVGDGMSAATFLASVGDHCRSCPARRCCPAQDEGAQVTP
ncbi:MAG: PD-(D/E)XK nuclease family protein, partial [Nocardioidaceae bacterium]